MHSPHCRPDAGTNEHHRHRGFICILAEHRVARRARLELGRSNCTAILLQRPSRGCVVRMHGHAYGARSGSAATLPHESMPSTRT